MIGGMLQVVYGCWGGGPHMAKGEITSRKPKPKPYKNFRFGSSGVTKRNRVSPPLRPRAYSPASPADASRPNLASSLGLLSWRLSKP
jgi:hypothetical protein